MKARYLLLVFCIAGAADGQTVVRVQSAGLPVYDADVAAWDANGRIATLRTDGTGSARIAPSRQVTTGAFVVIRKMGFVPVRFALDGRDSIVVTLSLNTTTLPTLAVESTPLRCPLDDDAAADSLWRTAAARYLPGISRLYFQWKGGRVEETVTPDQRGYGDGGELRDGTGGRYPVPEKISIAPQPYATYERHVSLVGEYWRWRYRPLEGFDADHFASPAFRESHTLMMLGRSGDAAVIGFCARDRKSPDIDGELQVGFDARFRSARWFFRLPHDDEDAGGEAAFGTAEFEGASYLVAVRGSSWRRAGKNLYNQERYENTEWWIGRTLEASAPKPPGLAPE